MIQENKATGRKADLMMAAYTAAEIALRMVKPGAEVSWGTLVLLHVFYKSFRPFKSNNGRLAEKEMNEMTLLSWETLNPVWNYFESIHFSGFWLVLKSVVLDGH